MNCYLPTSNIRTSPTSGSPGSIIHKDQFVSRPASTFDTTSSASKKRKAGYIYEASEENTSSANSLVKTVVSGDNTSPACELQVAKRQKLPRSTTTTSTTTTSSSSSSDPINNRFSMATTVANPASGDAAAAAAAAAAVSNNTPPASPESQNTLSNKSSASSLNSNASASTASSSVITDCSLNYFDTLPTNINKICSTTASHDDPWDLSEEALHAQRRHNQSQYQHHHHHQHQHQHQHQHHQIDSVHETQASSFSDPETSITSRNSSHNSYNVHSSNAVAELKQPKLASELQEIESFYIGWRKNFEKWLLMKNPKKYNEFKSFLKFNSVDKEGLDFEQYAQVSQNKRSSPVSSPVKGQQHHNHNPLSQSSIRSSHSQQYHYHYQNDRYSDNYKTNDSNNNSSNSDSSIRNKINQYLVKKPVFNSKISKKFKNKSNEMILNNIIKKRNDATSLMSYSHHSAAIGKSINSLERHKISNSAGASSLSLAATAAAATAAATPRSIAREHNGNSASSIKLSPILSIPKTNDREGISTTSAKNNSNASNSTTTAKNEKSGQAIRLPSINEILDSESFSVAKISSPSRSSSSTYLPSSSASVAVGDRRSISTSSIESANSVFSDNGTASAQSSFLADDGLNSGTAAATAATSKLSPPLIAFKSSSGSASNHQSSGGHNHYMSRLPDALTPTLHSSASPYPPVFPSYQHNHHQFQHHHQLASPATSPEKKSPFKKSTSVSPSKKSTSSSSGTSNSTNHGKRTCLSCGSSSSPCWRPSWSLSEGQLCNSCGLRYKKTNARCLNDKCLRIPAKGEFGLIKNKANGIEKDYRCLRCSCHLELKKT